MRATKPGVRGGRGGCEAEAHPASGKLSHLFARPVWDTPRPVLGSDATPVLQPGEVFRCPQEAHWHFWDGSRGSSGPLGISFSTSWW